MAASTIAANRIRTFIFSPVWGTPAHIGGMRHDRRSSHVRPGRSVRAARRVDISPGGGPVCGVHRKSFTHFGNSSGLNCENPLRLRARPPNGGLFGAGRHTHNSGVIVLDTQGRCAVSRTAPQMLTPTGAFLPICVVSG